MSQASKQVKWCLKKTDKEIKECKKLGKRQKHRGLLKGNPDIEEAKKHLTKAEHNLEGISEFSSIGYSDWSLSAGFYCIYHCFLAIASKFGYESRNQTCTISLIRYLKEIELISLDEKFIKLLENSETENGENSIIDLREDYT